MDETLVDVVLILLAALVAIAVVRPFEVEPPTSTEAQHSQVMLRPLQVAIEESGQFITPSETGAGGLLALDAQGLYDLVVATHPDRIVEFTAASMAPATLLLEANRVVQKAGRNAVFLVVAGSSS